jgi:hypothetical protein
MEHSCFLPADFRFSAAFGGGSSALVGWKVLGGRGEGKVRMVGWGWFDDT